jgi:acetyltransferase-like isoleucine patch superfamily enzyme
MNAFLKKNLKLLAKHVPGRDLRIKLLRWCGYKIGNRVYIGEDIIIIDELGESNLTLSIGDRAAISPRVTLVMHTQPNDSRIVPYVNSRKGNITIGSDAWIGTGAVVLPDVEVGEGAVVGANAVVTKSVPPYTVVAGLPARFVKFVDVPWYKPINSAQVLLDKNPVFPPVGNK